MQIKLTPSDVKAALIASLKAKGVDVNDDAVTFEFYNRRTKGGIFADVTIGTLPSVAVVAAEPAAVANDVAQPIVAEPATPIASETPVLFG